jgi:phenylalanine ammonia-lyase
MAVRDVVGQKHSPDRPYIWDDHEQPLDEHIARIAQDIATGGQIVQVLKETLSSLN